MFLKDSVFKRMAKAAWKSGALMIAKSDRKYIVEMGKCVINVWDTCLPNKIKAILVELVGDLPEAGEGYLYGEGMDPQGHIDVYDDIFIEFQGIKPEDLCDKTCLSISHGAASLNVMQISEDVKEKHLINSGWFSLIDEKKIDKEKGEYAPGRPGYKCGFFLFGNNHMILKVPAADMMFRSDKIVMSIEDDLTPANDTYI